MWLSGRALRSHRRGPWSESKHVHSNTKLVYNKYMKKLIPVFYWVLVIGLILVTIYRTTPISLAFSSTIHIVNFIQRFAGLMLFSLLFIQVILGGFMAKIAEKLGGWVFEYHVFEGIVIYTLALAHPLSFLMFNKLAGGSFDLYFGFINICLLCKTSLDYYYTLGRISFWLLTLAVLGAELRSINPWMKANWRKLHVLNYVMFLIMGLHGFLTGTDFSVQPFFTFAIIAYVIIVGMVVFVEIPRLYKNFRGWIKN